MRQSPALRHVARPPGVSHHFLITLPAVNDQVGHWLSADLVRLLMSVLVSLVMLGVGIYILLHGEANADLQKAATGWIGLVIGYWLQ